ncbi:MAG: rhamnulokinase [Paramuribaculum sp.]|nr:rhamnulokinase [Paramuribaculum sp.]
MSRIYLAADFGGGSGRVIAGHIGDDASGKTLVMEEIHRFPNRVVRIGDYLYWDFPALFAELKEGLAKAAAKFGYSIASIGIDTWGVDFGLIDKLGNLVGNPICYRDTHTQGLVEEFSSENDPSAHYAEAGIQMLPINTMFRLISMVKTDDPKLRIADKLLFMPDLFSYYLTGKAQNEYTIASTSELLDARTRQWNTPLIEKIGVDASLFGRIVMPGESRGAVTAEISRETGLCDDVKVIAVGSHDTASAVFAAAESYDDGRSAFLSSGTWSLLGVLTDDPVLTEEARLADYTNEGAVGGKIRLLTNITGLWILQRLAAQWKSRGENVGWSELIDEAEGARDTSIIDVDDPLFQNPDNMEGNILAYCEKNGLQAPGNRGEFVRCVCNSLAVRYKKAIEDLNTLLPEPIRRLKIFGGGASNRLLNRLTAEATGLEVTTGAREATAIGNILVQAIADGSIKDKSEITEIIEP